MDRTHLIATESYFAAASGAAPNVAVVANVANTVGEFGLKADVTSGIQLHAGLLLLLGALSDLHFQRHHLILLASAKRICKINYKKIYI